MLAVASTAANLGPELARELDRSWSRRPRGGGESHSRMVAEVYEAAVRRGFPPRHVVAAVWSRSLGCVDNWLREARKHKVLGVVAQASRPGRDEPAEEAPRRPVHQPSEASPHVDATSQGARVGGVAGFEEWEFHVRFSRRDHHVCALTMESARPASPHHLTPKGVGAMPISQILRLVVPSVDYAEDICTYDLRPHLETARLVAGPLGARKRGEQHLRQVAKLYGFALSQRKMVRDKKTGRWRPKAPLPPLKLMRAVWGVEAVSYSTASRWTMRARAAGVLSEDLRWSPRLDPRTVGRPLKRTSAPA